MATLNGNYISVMADSLNKKIKILEAVIALNEEQNKILSDEEFDLDGFDLTVQEKAKYIDELDLMDEGFAALFDKVKAELDGKREEFADEIKEMQKLIRTITELGAKVETGEKRNKALADRQFTALKKEVKEAKMSSQTASKYYRSMSQVDSTPQFVDSKH